MSYYRTKMQKSHESNLLLSKNFDRSHNINLSEASLSKRNWRLNSRIVSEFSVDHYEKNDDKKSYKDPYRIVVLGSMAVGKTAIVQQFLYGSFNQQHCATVEELHKRQLQMSDGTSIDLEILDTSGSFEFPAMRRLAISTGHAFALVYSIDDQASFEQIKNIRDMILQLKNNNPLPPIVIVGNKSDLDHKQRQVKFELAECCSMDWGHDFVECSAKDNSNIIDIFSYVLVPDKCNVNQSNIRNQNRRSSLPISQLLPNRSWSSNNRETNKSNLNSTFSRKNSCSPS